MADQEENVFVRRNVVTFICKLVAVVDPVVYPSPKTSDKSYCAIIETDLE